MRLVDKESWHDIALLRELPDDESEEGGGDDHSDEYFDQKDRESLLGA